MDITEVRIKLMEEPSERLQAFCSITFDDAFVVRDLKIIEGNKGPFVAMPSRKLTDRCPRCNAKNHLRAQNCNQCGLRLADERAIKDQEGRAKLHADIAHPINATAREIIQRRVLEAYRAELGRSKQPGYSSNYDDEYGEYEDRYATAAETFETDEHHGNVISRLESGSSEATQGPHRRPSEPRKPEKSPSKPDSASGFGRGILS